MTWDIPGLDIQPLGHMIPAYLRTTWADSRRADATGYEVTSSPAEGEFAAALFRKGFGDFAQQYQVGPFWIDFFFPGPLLAVEIDGKQWHTNQEKDRRRESYLLENGISWVVRVAAWRVFTDSGDCAARLLHMHEGMLLGAPYDQFADGDRRLV